MTIGACLVNDANPNLETGSSRVMATKSSPHLSSPEKNRSEAVKLCSERATGPDADTTVSLIFHRCIKGK